MGGYGTSGAKYNRFTAYNYKNNNSYILHIFTILNKNLTHHFTFNSVQLNALKVEHLSI